MKLLPVLAGVSMGKLFPNGKSNGDDSVSVDESGMAKIALNANANFFGVSSNILWVNFNGAISLNSLDDNSPDGFTKNVVLAGMWDTSGTMPNKGKVFYRVLGSGEFGGADFDDARAQLPAGYCASGCDTTMFTFKNIQNPMNSDQINTYQLIVTSDGASNHVVYNYHSVTYQPSSGTVGVYAAIQEGERCSTQLYDASSWAFTGMTAQSFGSDLECATDFETECPEPLPGTNAISKGSLVMGSSNPDDWQFVNRYECIPDFQINKNTNFVSATCTYDADYYDARWNNDAPTCVDMSAQKTFKASVQATKIDDMDAQEAMSASRTEGESDITEAIQNLAEIAGFHNDQISEISITGADPTSSVQSPSRSEEISGPVIVEFEITVPLAVKDKVTEDDIKESMKNILEEMPTVGDVTMDANTLTVLETTEACLTECLGCKDPAKCGDNPPPIPFDACCGGCPADNPSKGKPYSTLLKACCVSDWDGEIYDPDTHVCCNGEVIEIGLFQLNPSMCA